MAQSGVVFIDPIVAHLSTASDMAEVGIGGGGGDLEQNDELILSPEDAQILLQRLGSPKPFKLSELTNSSVRENENLLQSVRDSLPDFLLSATSAQHPITINLPRLGQVDEGNDENQLTDLQRALRFLTQASQKGRGKESAGALPNKIKFPYSRHSSYRELCHLLQVLRPKDVWPCTVDPVRWVREGVISGFPACWFHMTDSCARDQYQRVIWGLLHRRCLSPRRAYGANERGIKRQRFELPS